MTGGSSGSVWLHVSGRIIHGDLPVRWSCSLNCIRRTIDAGMWKCLLDTFTHAGLYNDDSQICKLTVIKREPMPPDGMAYIRISEWKNEDRTADDAGKSSRNS